MGKEKKKKDIKFNIKKEDKDWKEKVVEDKKKEEFKMPPLEVNFMMFITSLSMQAMMSLGLYPNPITKKEEKNLGVSKYTIDTITMIQEKTKGNLTSEESRLIDNILYDLRMKYIETSKEPVKT
ncbi:MAG: DUF1844 domain-containing protein [bacterium]|nr:DUF1844 domain-containing protein [bacterium]